MQISSSAGEFDFDITSIEAEDNGLVLVGKMGVWEARTVVSEQELIELVGLSVRSSGFWKTAIRLPIAVGISLITGNSKKSGDN